MPFRIALRVAYGNVDQFAAGLETKPTLGPGLYIQRIGSVTLPFAPEITTALRAVCQPAVTCLGNKAHTVHTGWQLEPTAIAASNAGRARMLGIAPPAVRTTSELCVRAGSITYDQPKLEAAPDLLDTLQDGGSLKRQCVDLPVTDLVCRKKSFVS